MTKSYKIQFNTNNMQCWENKSSKGKIFYSIVLPEQIAKDRFPDVNVKLNFTSSPKFLYTNVKDGEESDRIFYLIEGFDYKINIWDVDKKEATEDIIKGNSLLQMLKDYVQKIKITELKPKKS